MADKETEVEWAKSKRIEAEREKAARAVLEEDQKYGKVNVAYLDPVKSKVRGWSSDSRLVIARAEKLATWSVILAPTSVVLMIIADVGDMVSMVNQLGLAGVMFSIPRYIGDACLLLSVFFGLIGILTSLYYKIKNGKECTLPISPWEETSGRQPTGLYGRG